jgi:hypothetical protein
VLIAATPPFGIMLNAIEACQDGDTVTLEAETEGSSVSALAANLSLQGFERLALCCYRAELDFAPR